MTSEKKWAAFLSISACWMFYLFSYIARVEQSVLSQDLSNEFGIDMSLIGMIGAMAYIPYVIMQIPCGLITDKLGTKKMVLMSSILCSIGTFIFGSAHSVFQLEVGRFMIGLASASAFLCCGKVANDFFDKRKYSILMGFAMLIGCLGGIAGSSPTAYLVSVFGWRIATYFISGFGCLLVLFVFFFMDAGKKVVTNERGLLTGLAIISRNPKAWCVGFYGAIAYLPLSAFAELWIVPFMQQRFPGISTEKAALSSILLFLGFACGGLLSAWIAEKINSYKKTLILFTIGLVPIFWVALYVDSIGFCSCMVLLFIGATCAGANTLAFTFAYHMVPSSFGGTSAGFMNALVMMSGAVFQPFLGKLLDFFRNGLVDEAGNAVYNLTMYRSAFLFVIIGMVFATIVTFFINDVRHSQKG